MISGFLSSGPALGSVRTVWSLLGILSPSFSAAPLLSLLKSIRKEKKKRREEKRREEKRREEKRREEKRREEKREKRREGKDPKQAHSKAGPHPHKWRDHYAKNKSQSLTD